MASFLLWLIEGSSKTFQQANYHRLRTIEAFMRGKIAVQDFRLPDITGAWSVGWRKPNLLRIMLRPRVFVPHAVVVMVSAGMWVANLRLNFIGSLEVPWPIAAPDAVLPPPTRSRRRSR